MTNIANLTAANSRRWSEMHVHPQLEHEIDLVAERLIDGKPHYLPIAAKTGVPWHVIAVIHEREASGKWTANIAQGDRWDRKSTHVPAGRGPFASFGDAAYDALVNCAPRAARWRDWSPGGTLTILEEYNGLGYAAHERPSPYNWAGTDQYISGKYVADGQYDPNAVDHQLGCAALIARMMVLDPSIKFGAVPTPSPTAAPSKPVIVATGAAAGTAVAVHHHGWTDLIPHLPTPEHPMLIAVDLLLAMIVAYALIDFAQDYWSATGTVWQRLLATGKQSATILWTRFTVLVTGLAGGIAWVCDLLNAPGVGTAIQGAMKPQYVALLTVGIAVVTEVARRRTLPAAPPPAA